MNSLPYRKILLYYSTAASLFLTLSGFFSVKEIKNASFQLIFLPVTMFLFLSASSEIKASLQRKATSDETGLSGNKRRGFVVFFSILYIILLAIGMFNLQNSSQPAETVPSDTQSSTPLIFETPDEEVPE